MLVLRVLPGTDEGLEEEDCGLFGMVILTFTPRRGDPGEALWTETTGKIQPAPPGAVEQGAVEAVAVAEAVVEAVEPPGPRGDGASAWRSSRYRGIEPPAADETTPPPGPRTWPAPVEP